MYVLRVLHVRARPPHLLHAPARASTFPSFGRAAPQCPPERLRVTHRRVDECAYRDRRTIQAQARRCCLLAACGGRLNQGGQSQDPYLSRIPQSLHSLYSGRLLSCHPLFLSTLYHWANENGSVDKNKGGDTTTRTEIETAGSGKDLGFWLYHSPKLMNQVTTLEI